jgi:hypothetical protein
VHPVSHHAPLRVQSRLKDIGYLSGSLRYEVLKRAGFRCELCGIPADERAIEVDHILPRKHGGEDDLTNLQALCFKCNANKGARDDEDFRIIREGINARQPNCVFCGLEADRIVTSNSLALWSQVGATMGSPQYRHGVPIAATSSVRRTARIKADAPFFVLPGTLRRCEYQRPDRRQRRPSHFRSPA